MKADRNGGRFRRYVLGAATDAEREAIERAYFERADGLDAVSAAEDDLIDDYLAGRLGGEERDRFERHYLATPGHRRRVAVVRAIRTAASATPSVEGRRSGATWWAAAGLAAAMVVLVVGAAWSIRSQTEPAAVPIDGNAGQTAPPPAVPPLERDTVPRDPAQPAPDRRVPVPGSRPAEPTVVALSISPILARGTDEPATIAIARGTDTVRLLLLGELDDRGLGRGRAIIRTVAGREVWQGSTVRSAAPAGGEPARVDVPAALLPPDDYIVQLLGTDSRGTEVERYRYFFSVRAP
jgi:hypothetical protein